VISFWAQNPLDTIPMKVWTTNKVRKLGEKLRFTSETWKLLNPTVSWELQDDNDATLFFGSFFGHEMMDLLRRFESDGAPGVMKADIWRYAILFAHGGFYSDIDAEALKPIDRWFPPIAMKENKDSDPYSFIKDQDVDFKYSELKLNDCSIVIGLENDVHMCQWAIAGTKGHPILKQAIELIIERGKNGINKSVKDFVHYHTGPGVWSAAVAKSLGLDENKQAIEILKMVWTNKEIGKKARDMRLCLMSQGFFNGQNVKNHYASQMKIDDGTYTSWLKESEMARKKFESGTTLEQKPNT